MATNAIIFASFILITSIWAIGTGISHAIKPLERKLTTLLLLSLASGFASVGCAMTGSIRALLGVSQAAPNTSLEQMAQIAAGGIAEAMAGAAIGISLLAVAWLASAIGSLKQAESPENTDRTSSYAS